MTLSIFSCAFYTGLDLDVGFPPGHNSQHPHLHSPNNASSFYWEAPHSQVLFLSLGCMSWLGMCFSWLQSAVCVTGGRGAMRECIWTRTWLEAFSVTLSVQVLCASIGCGAMVRHSNRAASGILSSLLLLLYLGARKHTLLLRTRKSLKCWTCNCHIIDHLL